VAEELHVPDSDVEEKGEGREREGTEGRERKRDVGEWEGDEGNERERRQGEKSRREEERRERVELRDQTNKYRGARAAHGEQCAQIDFPPLSHTHTQNTQ